MHRFILATFFVASWLACEPNDCRAAKPLTVVADFQGASVEVLRIDQEARSVQFTPGGDPARGWPCWWYFRIDGITPGETITLRLQASSASVGAKKPLAASWAMPKQATFSIDGETWLHSDEGTRVEQAMVYTVQPDATSVSVAWGPPYTPQMAEQFVRKIAEKSPHAEATELCRSRGGRAVPMLHVREGDRDNRQRFGVWVQARQHAWESGSSWVAQGFAQWVTGDEPEAAWLRQHAEIFVVPIMDIDNTATGNGGKNALPHDHNRDWSSEPHWNEILAAQRRIRGLVDEQRMDVFLDLHNPAPGDPTFFYVLPREMLEEPMLRLRDRFIELAYGRISKIKPLIPMSNKPKVTGASYHPLWRQISSNWVSMNGNPHTVSLCLETIWNYKNSTTTGYQAVGANLAAAVQEYLAERPAKP
ncbi:M14-type cytosolic carboxypeptidase [Roseimaritima ulvae]|uniref:Zinc carboxypeptidase n=1 Tax=Roseimaritima ulvae TaxID=980254 RepID=A0A5B9QJ86_9BACT|nr:M14-type cytosolic carboxypeptidase [Roseimaritima ulvae]QEG38079.1 Zinc carboxypeptidase [Roseimaritima ulvae]